MTVGRDDLQQTDDRSAASAEPVHTGPQLIDIEAGLAALRQAVERNHERAAARERVIEHLNDELDRLRLGDRRTLIRPLLVELCRLRDDLVKQSDSLPDLFSASQARDLLASYADTIELTLEAQGVIPFTVDKGSQFDPRRHRRVSETPTSVEAQHGAVAATERSGYLDVETDRVLQQAGVVLFAHEAGSVDPAGSPLDVQPGFDSDQLADTTTEEQR